MQGLGCEVCECRPATRFVARRHVGMLLVRRSFKVDAVLCRVHATEIARKFLGLTLMQGWWGITAFFLNIAAVLGDVVAIVRAQSMPVPIPSVPPP